MELNLTAVNVIPFILWLYSKSFTKVMIEQWQQTTAVAPQKSDLSRTIQSNELMELNDILLQIEHKRTQSCLKGQKGVKSFQLNPNFFN